MTNHILAIQAEINKIASIKIDVGEYVGSRLGKDYTGLGVILIYADTGKHIGANIEQRGSSLRLEVALKFKKFILKNFPNEVDSFLFTFEIEFEKGEWDNNQNRILTISTDFFKSTFQINEVVNLMKSDSEMCSYFSVLYEKGITDLVFMSPDRFHVFTFFFYIGTQPV
jgi:hypothetical protein